MNYVNLGASGLKVSRIALGMMTFGTNQWRPWVLDEEEARPIVRRAVELGINVFDTADMYSAGVSEEITGRLVREYAQRDEVVVATKVFMPVELGFKGMNVPGQKPQVRPNMQGLSRKRIFAAVDASLTRLGMDWIDLYQIHRFDPATPVEETMEALHDVVKAGKVRYIGASSMCLDQGVGLMPWSPLARGFLAGNRGREDKTAGSTSRAQTDDIAQRFYYQDSDFAVVDALKKVADGRGESMARVAYGWLLGRPGVTAPIVGASKVWQLEEAVSAITLTLTEDESKALESAYRPHPVLGHT
jgi:aryl-alcohol dehydrogenase-like predicted oxidoreductase